MTNDPIKPVEKQWRCLEDGLERTSWKDVNVGDLAGWLRYAEKRPDRVVIEYRDIYGPEVLARIAELEAERDGIRDKALEDAAQLAETETFSLRMNSLLVRNIQDKSLCAPCRIATAIRQMRSMT